MIGVFYSDGRVRSVQDRGWERLLLPERIPGPEYVDSPNAFALETSRIEEVTFRRCTWRLPGTATEFQFFVEAGPDLEATVARVIGGAQAAQAVGALAAGLGRLCTRCGSRDVAGLTYSCVCEDCGACWPRRAVNVSSGLPTSDRFSRQPKGPDN